ATDLVLVVTQMLRSYGVVGAFVEFTGDGLAGLALADRATISNMSPEFGATATLFPIDDETLAYLRLTGRPAEQVELVERYARAQGLWRLPGVTPAFDALLTLDLGSVEPSLAGPKRPQDRVALRDLKTNFRAAFPQGLATKAGASVAARASNSSDSAGSVAASGAAPAAASYPAVRVEAAGRSVDISTGSVAIAAITSCTNTSNPTVMVAAGLLARNAVARGLTVPPTVKTSLAPGSRAVTEYLRGAGLLEPLEKLGFALAGYGCTTCIGNSGPLPDKIAESIAEHDSIVAAVLSGNRNFEGRIHPQVRANYLASPPLVVAYALAGRMDVDLTTEPIGTGSDGKPVFLKEIWPSNEEITKVIASAVTDEMFKSNYADVFRGDDNWAKLDVPTGERYAWDPHSEYVKKPPYFENMPAEPAPLADIKGARALALLGDSVTTDHISPAGNIAKSSPAAKYLMAHGVQPADFNSYGARRGNHEVMMRGTFANVRLRNQLVPGVEGGYTRYLPGNEQMSIFDAAMKYKQDGTPLVILAGKEYGSGSSRDWAAKGPHLLGIKAVIAESFERIHRSNLIGMGILPLQFIDGADRSTYALTGEETYDIVGIENGITPRMHLTVRASDPDRTGLNFRVLLRIDTPDEAEYYRHGGILQYVLRQLKARHSAS
ncbi:MAG: aconitate hydratase AcnA, partial [Vulcanimicrobiaceae bacterium]